jgi:tetratricopeptide (TPR) repeat protein
VVVSDGSDVAVVAASVTSLPELSRLLQRLRRREARARRGSELTYRELATRMNCSLTTVGEYLTGVRLAPTSRFDVLVQALGASESELGALATAWDRVADALQQADKGAMDRPPVPRELPARDSCLVARELELAELDSLLAAEIESSTMVISVVSGMAGVGKTALAVEWAHRVADRFPDGQLFVNLRGYDQDEPVDAGAALAGFLRSLGVAGPAIPADPDERAARFRSLIAERRMLVLLDNASTAEQVRALLPGTRSCAVVVTSRDDLAGLGANPGARRLDLEPLTDDGAEALLRASIGARTQEDPLATAALAQRCGRLPLALRIAAELATGRAGTDLAALVAELADADLDGDEASARLDLLDTTGDSRTSVRSVFSWSLRDLPAEVSRAFVLLGLHPGGDIDGHAAAALVGRGVADTRSLLRRLVRAHLVDRHGADRFSMHDLLRAYAAEQALIRSTPQERHAALTRLFDYYRQVAEVAGSIGFSDSGKPGSSGMAAAPELSGPRQARAWLDGDRSNLVAVCRHAARHGWPAHSIALSVALWPYLDQGYNHEALAVHASAAEAARAGGGDPADHGSVLTHLGITYWRLGRQADALAQLQEALARHREVDNREGMGRTLAALGMVYDTLGRYAKSLECNDRGLANARALADRFAEARHLINLGHGHLRLEQYEQAEDCYRQARRIGEQLDMPRIRTIADHGLGVASDGMGRYDEALAHLLRVLDFYREFGEMAREIRVLEAIAGVYQRLERFGEAFSHLDRALDLSRRLDDEAGQIMALNTLGETLLACKDFSLARDRSGEALSLACRAGDRLQRARALDGLGDGHRGAGDFATALGHWHQAHTAYTELGHPAAARVSLKIEDALARQQTSGV